MEIGANFCVGRPSPLSPIFLTVMVAKRPLTPRSESSCSKVTSESHPNIEVTRSNLTYQDNVYLQVKSINPWRVLIIPSTVKHLSSLDFYLFISAHFSWEHITDLGIPIWILFLFYCNFYRENKHTSWINQQFKKFFFLSWGMRFDHRMGVESWFRCKNENSEFTLTVLMYLNLKTLQLTMLYFWNVCITLSLSRR